MCSVTPCTCLKLKIVSQYFLTEFPVPISSQLGSSQVSFVNFVTHLFNPDNFSFLLWLECHCWRNVSKLTKIIILLSVSVFYLSSSNSCLQDCHDGVSWCEIIKVNCFWSPDDAPSLKFSNFKTTAEVNILTTTLVKLKYHFQNSGLSEDIHFVESMFSKLLPKSNLTWLN